MSQSHELPEPTRSPAQRYAGGYSPASRSQPQSLADILERVLDKGIVIAGDIQVNLLEIELLTIKIRLLVASVDKAAEMGIDWWRSDPMLSGDARRVAEENAELRRRVQELEGRSGTDGEPAAEHDDGHEDGHEDGQERA